MKKKTNKRTGRRSNYYDKVEPRLEEVRAWRMEGQSEKNIAKLLGVSEWAISEYKNKHPDFAKVLKESKEVLIGKLEITLFQRALGGMKVTDTKKRITKDSAGKDVTFIEETTRELEPNMTALIFALKNLTKGTGKWMDVRMIDMLNTRMEDDENLAKIAEALDSLGDKYSESKENQEE